MLIGLSLMALGGYYYFDTSALTSLIPAYFGVAFLLLGVLALIQPKLRMHYMHFIALGSLVGVVAGLMRSLPKAIAWAKGTAPEHPAAVTEQLVMTGLCLVLLFACVNSVLTARRWRKTQEAI